MLFLSRNYRSLRNDKPHPLCVCLYLLNIYALFRGGSEIRRGLLLIQCRATEGRSTVSLLPGYQTASSVELGCFA